MFHTKPEDLTDSERQEIPLRCGKKCARFITGAICQLLTALAELPGSARFIYFCCTKCGKPPRPAENPQRRIATGFLVVVVHPLFHFIASEFQLIGATITSSPSIHRVYSCPARCQAVRYLSVRALLVPLHQARPGFFHLFIKPVPDHFMPHGHTHFTTPVISRRNS